MTDIKLYCTLAREKVTLKPIRPGEVAMYACGVTVYDESHIGHAMQAIIFDVLRNFLEYVGFKVHYVRNYTDVDDKIINRAKTLGISPLTLSERIIASNVEDFRALHIKSATDEPKVSENIPEIIAMIEDLIANGYAYVTDSQDVYYRVRKKADYGKLSNRRPDELQSGTRAIVASEKTDELDFALWKRDTTEGASWSSPFGPGRPGWHIECSAMAKRYLGPSFDIHGGGLDLVFPHHENEIAQSEAANSCSFANIWMHCGLLTLNKQKMSKSLGNSITIKAFLQDWPAEVLRLAFLSSHYRSPLDFNDEMFRTCLKRLYYYYETQQNLAGVGAEGKEGPKFDLVGQEQQWISALADDFNTPQAIALLNGLLKQVNTQLARKQVSKAQAEGVMTLLKRWGGVLGLMQEAPEQFMEKLKDAYLLREVQNRFATASEKPDLPGLNTWILEKIAQRKSARDTKDWSKADDIRKELAAYGIALRDGVDKTVWTPVVDAT